MDKFIFITDTHIANKQPASRLDDYNGEIFKKIQFVLEYAKKHNIKKILHGGDIAHNYRIGPELFVKFIKLFVGFEVYWIYGNHDVYGENYEKTDKSNFGILELMPNFHLVSKNSKVFKYTEVAGLNYNAEVTDDYVYTFKTKKNKILLTHPMIVNEKTMFITGDHAMSGKMMQINVNEVHTNADLMLCGHYHIGFPEVVHLEQLEHKYMVCNPGSIARTSIKEGMYSNGPRFAVISSGNDGIKVSLKKIPHNKLEEAFDVESYNENKEQENYVNNFISVLRDSSLSVEDSLDLSKSLKAVIKSSGLKLSNKKKVIMECKNAFDRYRVSES